MNTKNKNAGLILLMATLGFSLTGLGAANPVIDPPGGNVPTAVVDPAERLIPQESVQHVVCFKFKVPTSKHPLNLPSLQTLDEQTGEPVVGSAPQTTLTFTDLPSLAALPLSSR